MRDYRNWFVMLVGALFFGALALSGRTGPAPVLMADEAGEMVYLPIILAKSLPPASTPTASPTVTLSPSQTATATTTVTVTATATISSTLAATATDTATATPTSTATPASTSTPTATATLQSTPIPGQARIYLPLISSPPILLDVPVPVSKSPPIDFAAERAAAQAKGQDLAFNKIGFHIQLFGGRDGLQSYIEELDAAGVPVVLKTANDAEYLYKAQELGRVSGVEHVLIYRDTTFGRDIPDYTLDPITAARLNWAENRRVFPPELDPARVWMETTNEPDRTKSAWLAEFALEQAKMAVREGARFAAFGWSGGEPEPEHWETPEMLAFLRYAAEHPDQVAVALHEYSFVNEGAGVGYPDLVGRFQALFAAADKHGIPRPTVLITEWGWTCCNDVPKVEKAMDDIAWAAWLYAAYPEVKGAAIWTLGIGGGEYGSIGEDVEALIGPLKMYSQSNYFLFSPGTRPIDADALAPDLPPGTPTATPSPTATTDPLITPTVTSTPTITPTPSQTPVATAQPTADPNSPLVNGSFEEGWTDVLPSQKQQPKGWTLSWVPSGQALPPEYEPNGTIVTTGTSEDIHKDLLAVDPDSLVIDGNWTYKMFNGNGDAGQIWATTLSQTILGMQPGSAWRLTVPMQLHKAPDADPWGSETSVWVNGDTPGWANQDNIGDRRWCRHVQEVTVPGDGRVQIDIRIKTKWMLAKTFFVDDVRLEPAANSPAHGSMPLCVPEQSAQEFSLYRSTFARILDLIRP